MRHRVDASGLEEEIEYQEEGKEALKSTFLSLQMFLMSLLSLIVSDIGRMIGIVCEMLPVPSK